MAEKFKFTGASLARLKPADGQYKVWDTERRGLGLRVSPGGRKTFFFKKNVKGRTVEKTLGSMREFSLDRARAMVEDLATQLAGSDAFQVTKTDWKTIDELISLYHQDGLAIGLKRPDDRTKGVCRAFGPLVSRKANEVTEGDIRDRLDTFQEEVSLGRAAKLQTHLGGFYKWARYDRLVPTNFMDKIRPRKSYDARARYLNPDQIGIVWTAAMFLSPAYRDCVRMLLITGQRRSEVAEAPKSEVDLRQAVWSISKELVKSKRSHKVPLGALGRQIIADRIEATDSEFLFTTDGKVPINGFSDALNDLNDAADRVRRAYNETVGTVDRVKIIERFTFHDMRRTLATQWPEMFSATKYEVDIHQNHALQGVSKHYHQETLLARRRKLTELWETKITEFASHYSPR